MCLYLMFDANVLHNSTTPKTTQKPVLMHPAGTSQFLFSTIHGLHVQLIMQISLLYLEHSILLEECNTIAKKKDSGQSKEYYNAFADYFVKYCQKL